MTHRRTAVAAVFVALLVNFTPPPGQAQEPRSAPGESTRARRPADTPQPPPATRAAAVPAKLDIHAALAFELDTDVFTTPMTFKDFAGLIYDKVRKTRGIDLPILVDVKSFKELNPDSPTPYDATVSLPPVPQRMPVRTMLEIGVMQLSDATYIIRDGAIWIVTTDHAAPAALLHRPVLMKFSEVPLEQALRQLSDKAGVSIVLDTRAKEKNAAPVSADFRHDVDTESAVRMLANMAGLRAVLMGRGVYVTTPENAAALEQELKSAAPGVRKRK
jgi:hypothetical protein